MCYYTKVKKDAKALENQYKAKFKNPEAFVPSNQFNGFTHPETPIITNSNKNTIQLYSWGLMPVWAKDLSIRKNTLNAKIETIAEKPSFKAYQQQRCLILVNGFYEWQWKDTKGKNKQKYELTLPDQEIFSLGGLWTEWTDIYTNQKMGTYTIVTTEANALMSEIHNHAKRMPIVLSIEEENSWLNGNSFDNFATRDIELTAKPIQENPQQTLSFF